MRILVINSGSSSIKFSLFDSGLSAGKELRLLLDEEATGIGSLNARLTLHGMGGNDAPRGDLHIKAETPKEAIRLIFDRLHAPQIPSIEAVGYRVVHPGAKLDRHRRITPEVIADLEAASIFAPLHDPEVITVIREGMASFPNIAHYACFDTVFHQTMPVEATTYPIPHPYREQGARRYGFHGLSCESIVRQLRAEMVEFPRRLAIAHLAADAA